MCRIALVGDRDPQKLAHVAIPRALELARHNLGVRLDWDWIATDLVFEAARTLDGFAGIWVVPGSPYRDMNGALGAIRYAREERVPFLGTCGGFQHALIEFARNVAGIGDADHAETAPAISAPGKSATGERVEGPSLVITPLSCSMVEASDEISFTPGSRLHGLFAGQPARGEYHCNYGPNPHLESAGLRFTGFAGNGDIRAGELPSHPFFIGTLFQPERSALRGERHPVIEAFVQAAVHE
jgi:CTP synthase (UTP-ammonia lyase)